MTLHLPQGLSREDFLRWLALLNAALDQPHPTPELRRALAALDEEAA